MDIKKYTKQSIADHADTILCSQDITLTATRRHRLVNEMFEQFTLWLSEGYCLCFTGYATIYPRFKPGGRPVRAVKSAQLLTMPDTVTVRMSHSPPSMLDIPKGKKISFRLMCEKFTLITGDRAVATALISSFFDYFRLVLQTGIPMEIRHFGTFTRKTRPEKNARNPQTGEPVIVPPGHCGVFKMSAKLRQHLVAHWQS